MENSTVFEVISKRENANTVVPIGIQQQSHHEKADEVRKLLEMKFKNSDGNWCNVFTTKVNVDGWQRFGCLLCSKREMGILKLIKHAHSKNHKQQLCGEKFLPSNLLGDTGNSQLHARLNEINDQGIVGVEYIIEVVIGENLQSIFRCVLCEGRFDLETVQSHLTAYAHRLNYLEKHFATAFRKLSSLEQREQKFTFLKKICRNIEYHYGRLSTKVVESSCFYANELEIYECVSKARHFDEKMGRTFEELFCESGNNGHRLSPISDFEELSSTCGLDSLSTASEFERSPLAANYAFLSSIPDKKQRLSSISSENITKIGDEKKVQPTTIRRSTHGWKIANKSKIPMVYENMSDHIHTTSSRNVETNHLNFKEREKRHSIHPTKRTETAVSQNRDRSRSPHRHQPSQRSCSSFRDYQKPENITKFGTQRNSSSTQLSQLPHSHRRSDSSSFLSVKPSVQMDHTFLFEHTITTTSYLDPYKDCSPIQTNSESEIDDEPITIISVLSLLSAFENMLGSLGPKMIDLMLEAIAMEKISVNSSNLLLDNTNHCILFDTVKEKLKGHIQADIVEPSKLNGLKKTIKNMDILISEANARIRTIGTKETVPLISSHPESQDRSAIAAKMLLTLHNQGRADISKVDLAHYVDEYIKMSSAKHYDKPKDKQYDKHGIQSWLKEVEKSHQQYDETENNNVTAIEVVEKLPEECGEVIHVLDSIVTKNEEDKMMKADKKYKKKNPVNGVVECSMTLEEELQSKPDEPVTLSDSNLKTLIKNFRILTDAEKQDVIVNIRELGPERMDRLRNEIQIDSFLNAEFGWTKMQEDDEIIIIE